MAEPTFRIEAAGSYPDREREAKSSSARRKATTRLKPRPELNADLAQADAGEIADETDEHNLDTVA